jgi:hypothetical protein
METKSILWLVGGAAATYFGLTQWDKYKKKKAAEAAAATAAAQAAADPKLVACQSQLDLVLPLVKADLETFKAKFMADCLTRTPQAAAIPTEATISQSSTAIPSASSLTQGNSLATLDTLLSR